MNINLENPIDDAINDLQDNNPMKCYLAEGISYSTPGVEAKQGKGCR